MPAHLELFRCPVTGMPLRVATDGEDAAVRKRGQRIAERVAGMADGRVLSLEFVVDNTGEYAYPVVNGIFCLLPDYSISLSAAEHIVPLNSTKEGVRRFYDEVGWAREDDGAEYSDAVLFEDLRPVSEAYRQHANRRVGAVLPESGSYLLDVASGPIQSDDYLHFSDNFAFRVCVDLSYRALLGAQTLLGPRGVFVLGDITNLPLRDGAVDATISLHTIYHVPSDQQATAFEEIARVTQLGSVAVVVYSWGKAATVRAVMVPAALMRRSRSLLRRLRARAQREPTIDLAGEGLYFEPHSRRWFESRPWPFEYEIRVWRAVSVGFLTAYAREGFGGRRLLRAVSRAEDRWPRRCGEFGQYPLIIIRPAAARRDTGTDLRRPSAS